MYGWLDTMSRSIYSSVYIFFFFQAEDGIRDLTVTGVQTCALPILIDPPERAADQLWRGRKRGAARCRASATRRLWRGRNSRARAEAGARCSGAMLEGGPRPTKHRVPHRPAELPGVGVLPARVVGRDHDAPIGQVARDAVSERRAVARRRPRPPPPPPSPALLRKPA